MKSSFHTALSVPAFEQRPGFSMAEFMIALVIMSILIAFSVPKIFTPNIRRISQTEAATFLETLRILTDIEQNGIVSEDLLPENTPDYFISHLHMAKVCTTNANSTNPSVNANGPCWDASQGVYGSSPSTQPYQVTASPGFILANGAVVTGLDRNPGSSGTLWFKHILIDWNGIQGPNQIGSDQLYLQMCLGTADCPNGTGSTIKAGTIGPALDFDPPTAAINQNLYTRLLN